MNTAPVTDRPTHATEALVRRILEAHPEGLTDDRLWALTGLPGDHRGSVRRRRKDTGAVEVGKGVSDLGATYLLSIDPASVAVRASGDDLADLTELAGWLARLDQAKEHTA